MDDGRALVGTGEGKSESLNVEAYRDSKGLSRPAGLWR